jgi:hypothetical protein
VTVQSVFKDFLITGEVEKFCWSWRRTVGPTGFLVSGLAVEPAEAEGLTSRDGATDGGRGTFPIAPAFKVCEAGTLWQQEGGSLSPRGATAHLPPWSPRPSISAKMCKACMHMLFSLGNETVGVQLTLLAYLALT